MKHEEDAIQRALFQWITLATPRIPQLALAFAVPNGMAADAKVRIDKRTGKSVRYSPSAAHEGAAAAPRVPDIMIPARAGDFKWRPMGTHPDFKNYVYEVPYFGLAIELKSAKGVLTDYQKDWHERLRGEGWQVNVCRSFDEARQVIADYFGVKP